MSSEASESSKQPPVAPAPPTTAPVQKKPYKPPVLTVYGTIRELTKAVGIRGQRDSGTARPPNNKTTM